MKNKFSPRAVTLSLLIVPVTMAPVLGCAPAPATSPVAAPPTVITETHNNKKTALRVGEMLVVRLESNPTTGYEWSVAKTNQEVLAVAKPTEFDVPKGDNAGAPTTQSLFLWPKRAAKSSWNCTIAAPGKKTKRRRKPTRLKSKCLKQTR